MSENTRETKPADGGTDIRPVGRDKTGLILACALVIILAAFYAIVNTVGDLSSQLDALQRDNVNLNFHVKALGEKMFALQTLFESQSRDTEIVAFSARIKPSYTDIKPGATIVFADVETNVGNSYSGTSGEFTARVPGVYAFFGHILTAGNKYIETALAVNEETKLWLYAGGAKSFHGSGSNLLVVHLQKGDKVKMKQNGAFGTKPLYIHHIWSTFSGYLLRADK